LPGFLYLTVLYPIKSTLNCYELHSNRETTKCEIEIKDLNEIVTKIQLISLKLIKDIAIIVLEKLPVANVADFKLLSLKHLESICKRLDKI
jgi:hypothetical protein